MRAGTPLRDLDAELAEHGQHVAFDAARVVDGATVGGLVATADAGPCALVHGSLRDLVIGATLVLADGTVARTGGHVIKNVAGYDLAKLVHGSYGALAVIAEVVLRLHPLPHATGTLALPGSLDEAAEHAARVLAGATEPAALEWVSDPGALLVRLEGTRAALPARVERLAALLGRRAAGTESDPWDDYARLTRGTIDDTVLRIGVRPSRLAGVLNALPTRTITAGLGTGVATVTLPADPAAVRAAHETVHAARRDRPCCATGPSAWTRLPGAAAVGAAPSCDRSSSAFDPDRPARAGPVRPLAGEEPVLSTTPAGSAETRSRGPPRAPSTIAGRRRASCSTTASTAASACRPAPPTSCGARRWTLRAAASTS